MTWTNFTLGLVFLNMAVLLAGMQPMWGISNAYWLLISVIMYLLHRYFDFIEHKDTFKR